MCFSATASFVASGSIGALGAACLLKARKTGERPFAAVPLLFAVQQAVEGVIWLTIGPSILNAIAVKIYLLFAYAFWPAFIPWAVRKAEPSARRRKWMYPLVLVGWIIGLAGLRIALISSTPVAVFCDSLRYGLPMIHPAYGYLYVGIGCLTCLFSSSRWIVAFGVTLAASCLAAFDVYAATGPSVWCFFAALLSVLVFMHFRSRYPTTVRKKSRVKIT